MQFELGRADVTLTSYDFVNNKLIFKASLPETFAGKVYEVAIYSQATNALSGSFGSRLVSTFDSATEDWVDATTLLDETAWDTTTVRAGRDALLHSPAASTTKTSSLGNVVLDLSGYSGADTFNFAYNVGNTNASQLVFRFKTDVNNYYAFQMPSPGTAGYKVTSIAKSAATISGSPNWANITEIQVATVAGAGGAASLMYDGIRIEDSDTINPEYVMVARSVLGSPFTFLEGSSQDVEFALNISV